MIQSSLKNEIELRIRNISNALSCIGCDALLITSNVNLYYVSGRVFSGYALVKVDGSVTYFVKRPIGLKGDNVFYIRKPEQIIDYIKDKYGKIAFELGRLNVLDYNRLVKCFAGFEIVDGSSLLRKIRSVKTDYEIAKLKESGISHEKAYRAIKHIYKDGMTDAELQIEIEKQLRLQGSLGIFRIQGESMEIFMGSLICGDNADNPSPYDFAMGGAGLDNSLPVGCNGTLIKNGMSIMVDFCGNFNGYMTDMTRVFYVGNLDELAIKAHNVSISIHHRLASEAKVGMSASQLYEIAMEIVKEANLEEYFMGYRQKAGFIGHGVGIEINEAPVLAPRSKDILEIGNVIALEPKFVIPNVGAVGIENTYVLTDTGLECITNYPENLEKLS